MTQHLLILGGGGMLGHKLWQSALARFETKATVRSGARFFTDRGFPAETILEHVDVNDNDALLRAFAAARPDVVVNCVGVVKQLAAGHDPLISISLNSLLPHRLAEICGTTGARLIHISTDCVFSGRKGMYTESDVSDAEDLYGRTKILGEVSGPKCVTLRTSMIGRELTARNGLLEWFLSRRGATVNGYARAIFSGLTTEVLSRLILDVIEWHSEMSGVYHVSSDPISKYDLLRLLDEAYQTKTEIRRDESVMIDRSLDSTRFRAEASFAPPSWRDMVAAMAADPTPYDHWRETL
jgi:dTDP-4-dehydrorhamnose reductase